MQKRIGHRKDCIGSVRLCTVGQLVGNWRVTIARFPSQLGRLVGDVRVRQCVRATANPTRERDVIDGTGAFCCIKVILQPCKKESFQTTVRPVNHHSDMMPQGVSEAHLCNLRSS